MLHVDFKNCLCLLSVFLRFPCPFKKGPMSHVEFRNHPMACLLFLFACHYAVCLMSILRTDDVAMSSLRVKSPDNAYCPACGVCRLERPSDAEYDYCGNCFCVYMAA